MSSDRDRALREIEDHLYEEDYRFARAFQALKDVDEFDSIIARLAHQPRSGPSLPQSPERPAVRVLVSVLRKLIAITLVAAVILLWVSAQSWPDGIMSMLGWMFALPLSALFLGGAVAVAWPIRDDLPPGGTRRPPVSSRS